MSTITMPRLSPTAEQGVITRWLVRQGDAIRSGQVIAEAEADKATVEIEADESGYVTAILVEAGTAVAPGTSIVQIDAKRAIDVDGEPAISPLALRLARLNGVALTSLTGSGPSGRIMKRDVEATVGPPTHSERAIPSTPPIEPAETSETPAFDLIPLTPMRRVIAERMVAATRDVPHFSISVDIRMDALLASRSDLEGVTITDFCIRAVALALRDVPGANASYTPDGIRRYRQVDVALAVAVPDGLVTPIIHAADRLGLRAISHERTTLVERARAGTLVPHDYHGGTVTISNLGMKGIPRFTSIINEPHAMILSIGATERRVVAIADAPRVATVMTVTATCDHRALDGAVAADAIQAVKQYLEQPVRLAL